MAAFDLHIHSEYSSDGEFSVAELVGKCLGAQLTLFSLTDHNSVRGVGEAARLACERGIGFVPGIEIDCNYRGTDLHLLGYGIDWRSADFARLEEEVAAKVMASFGGMVDNLLKLGFSVDAEAVLAAAGVGLPTGELIAEVMLSDAKYHTPPLRPYMEGGARSDMPYINFYLDYFAQGRPAFVPVEYMDFRRAVELVRDNGGVPVVAHPGLNFRGDRRTAFGPRGRGTGGLQQLPHSRTGRLFRLAGPVRRGPDDLRERFPRQDQPPHRRRTLPVGQPFRRPSVRLCKPRRCDRRAGRIACAPRR